MGTEILRPQDCLRVVTQPTVLPRRKCYPSNFRSCRKNFIRPEKSMKTTKTTTTTTNDFVIGQVTILKRGESLDISSKRRISSDPKQIQISVVGSAEVLYAGSAFYSSPSPSSLPLPTFSKKKEELAAAAIIHDSATKDIRRLLRLD